MGRSRCPVSTPDDRAEAPAAEDSRRVRRHFEESAEEYFRRHSGEGGAGGGLLAGYLDALGPRLRGAAALDAGCGPGNFAHRLGAERGGLVFGVDFSRAMLRAARGRFPEVPVAAGDLRRLPFRSGAFDLAYSFRSLQHVPDLEAALTELVRVVAGGGHVVFDYVNRRNPLGILREKASGRKGRIYLKAHTHRSLRALCERVGLEPLERLAIQMFPDRGNLEKRLGPSLSGWLGPLIERVDRTARRWPLIDRLALRSLIVARKPGERRVR